MASIFLYSCENDVTQQDKELTPLTEEQLDQNIREISMVLAKAVANNKELVTEIEKEISYRFDYDNDALIRTFLGRKIAGEKFEDILSKSSNGKYSSKDIEKMILESGYLQFTFPQNYKSLDYESILPLAVPVYSYIEEEDTEYLESFDKDGNTVNLSAKEMPNVPVIVVGPSERVDEEGYMLVSERSVVLPKEMRTMHYTKAIEESRMRLKSTLNENKHIVRILSQEEFDKLDVGLEPKVASNYETNFKSATSPDIQLNVRTYNPKENELTWSSYSNGAFTSNKYEVRRNNVTIATINNYTTFFDNVPNANYSYGYQIFYYYNDIYLGSSNMYRLQSSHRRSGGQEYIDYLYASHQMVVALEGWWVSELEIYWHILAGKYDGTSTEIGQGGQPFQCKKETKKNIFGKEVERFVNPRLVGSYDDVNLFGWEKNDTFGSYTVHFREKDTNTDTETWKASVQIIAKVASILAMGNDTITSVIEEATGTVTQFIEALKKDDEIGGVHIAWSTPNGVIQPVNENGFNVIINQKN